MISNHFFGYQPSTSNINSYLKYFISKSPHTYTYYPLPWYNKVHNTPLNSTTTTLNYYYYYIVYSIYGLLHYHEYIIYNTHLCQINTYNHHIGVYNKKFINYKYTLPPALDTLLKSSTNTHFRPHLISHTQITIKSPLLPIFLYQK